VGFSDHLYTYLLISFTFLAGLHKAGFDTKIVTRVVHRTSIVYVPLVLFNYNKPSCQRQSAESRSDKGREYGRGAWVQGGGGVEGSPGKF
jgi:hypothetical protein